MPSFRKLEPRGIKLGRDNRLAKLDVLDNGKLSGIARLE